MKSRLLLIALSGLLCTSTSADDPRYELLVVSRGNDKLVRFDLSTGADRVLAEFPSGSKPSSLVANAEGRLFVSLRGNRKNVVELTPMQGQQPDGRLAPTDVTPNIGRFGPGMLAFDRGGRLYVAADTEQVVKCFDVTTRKPISTISPERRANFVGLTVGDDILYIAEYFQRGVLRVDLAADPPVAEPLITQSDQLNRPRAMIIGHSGNLLVSSAENDFLQEFDVTTGRFVRTFLDAKTLGASRFHELCYCGPLERYLVSSSDTVFALSTDGSLTARYRSPVLIEAQGIVCRPVRN